MNAINKYVIVKQSKEETTTESGIITNSTSKPTYTVISTTDETKELEGKEIFATEYHPLEEQLYSVHIDNITAWK